MKKRYTMLLAAAVSTALLAGCGRQEEPVSTETEVPDVVTSIDVDVAADDEKLLKDMTREELAALEPAEVKELVESQLPNYRDIFSIEDDHEMSDGDWIIVRDGLIYLMYGVDTSASGNTTETDTDTDTEDVTASSDPDRIYYAPTADEINAMTTEEFGEYLNGMCAYFGTGTEIDFTTVDAETLEERRAALLESISE